MKYLLLSIFFALTTLTIQPAFAQIDDHEVIDENPDNPGGSNNYGRLMVNTIPGNSYTGFQILFYEGNSATQDVISGGRVSGAVNGNWDSPFYPGFLDRLIQTFLNNNGGSISSSDNLPENDETRSLKMSGMIAGRKLVLFDSPSAETDDDWVEILIKQTIPATDCYQLDSYEHSYEDDYVKVIYHPHNGLDGKVSYLRTFMTVVL